jgi:hypothetical protein
MYGGMGEAAAQSGDDKGTHGPWSGNELGFFKTSLKVVILKRTTNCKRSEKTNSCNLVNFVGK